MTARGAALRFAAATAAALALAAPAGAQEPFHFSAQRLDSALIQRMRHDSWHQGCPVGLSRLRVLSMSFWGFDGRRRRGRMVVNADVVGRVRRAFSRLFDEHFPIRRMRLVDDYGGDDFASIAADNTSAFNCRNATDSTRFSRHAYGRAIDVNPIENPYVYANGTTTHPASRPYLDRSRHRKGMAFEGGALVRAFDAAGWSWGGRWPLPTDYQHFSRTGG